MKESHSPVEFNSILNAQYALIYELKAFYIRIEVSVLKRTFCSLIRNVTYTFAEVYAEKALIFLFKLYIYFK
jgi:hypothetical protein